jgi:hypothetical protein
MMIFLCLPSINFINKDDDTKLYIQNSKVTTLPWIIYIYIYIYKQNSQQTLKGLNQYVRLNISIAL